MMINPMQTLYKKSIQASLFVAASGILYGFLGFMGTTIIRENISISSMLFWGFFIAGVWMLLFVIRKHSTHRVFDYIDKRVFLFMFVLGAIGYAGSSGFYFIASQYTGTGLAMVIFFSYPIMIALSSWLVHKKQLNLGVMLSLAAMIIGLILLQDTSSPHFSIIGILFSIMAAACYTFYVMVS